MTGTEVIQFLVLVGVLSISYWWLWTWDEREQRNALTVANSAEYAVAQTGSMFWPSFDLYVEKGSTVYIPVADGLYTTRIKSDRCAQYKSALERWLQRGATIHMLMTRPSDLHAARTEWSPLLTRYPTLFFVEVLDRDAVTGPEAQALKSQIEKLDTFHAVLLVNPPRAAGGPGAMWIEGYHPIGSRYAYDVRFVHPADIATDGRFDTYKQMYESLINDPHTRGLIPDVDGRLAA
jgi:hypothetical protein